MSFTWWNCERGVLSAVIRAGQEIAIGLRVPPKCEATCFVCRNGVSPAQAQPAWYMLSTFGPPSASRPPSLFSASSCCSTVLGMLFWASSSLMLPRCPSALEPLSPKM
jgi:hypothetical protein